MSENIFLDGQGSFNHNTKNAGTIKWGDFNNAAVNTGSIVLSAVFTGSSVNSGTIGDLMPIYTVSVFQASSGYWDSTYSTVAANSASWSQGGGGSSDWNDITNKPTEFTPATHTHSVYEVTGLEPVVTWVTSNSGNADNALGNQAYTLISDNSATWDAGGDWSSITNKPATFAATAHTHSLSEVTGLEPVVTWVTSNSSAANNALGNQAYTLISDNSATWAAGGDWSSITNKPTEFTPATHFHHASSINAGVLDPARIPVVNTSIQVISQGGLADLTVSQQNEIVAGAIVTTTDGRRYVYVSGTKTVTASYIELADITPDWNTVSNKPTSFNPATHSHSISEVTGLQTVVSIVSSNSASWSAATNWNDVLNKPTSFNPATHTHEVSSVNGLQPVVTWVSQNSAASPSIINYIFDNGTSKISLNSRGTITMPINFSIVEWKIVADVSTSTVITLNKASFDSFPTMTSLGTVSLTNNRKNSNSSPGFSNLSADDILEFIVSANSDATKLTISLKGYKI